MQRNIDQLFKDGMDALAETPVPVTRDPEESWDRIDGMLGGEKKKRRGAWIWVSAAASVVLLIGIGWMLSGLGDNKPMKVVFSDENRMIFVPNKTTDKNMAMEEPPAPPIEEKSETEYQAQTKESPIEFRSAGLKNGRRVIRGGSYKDVDFFSATPLSNGSASTKATTAYATGSTSSVVSGSTITFSSARPSGATTYAWNFGDGTTNNGPTITQQYNLSGTYTVVVQDANGCTTLPQNGKQNKGKKTKEKKQAQQGYLMNGQNTEPYGSESYAETVENDYFKAAQEPLSTFSIDVDRASYTNHRRFIDGNALPPKYSVRVEEFINYFPYDYQPPHNGQPFSILPEVASCPWNPEHKLVRIALKGREVSMDRVPPSNIVFLLDVSGSMGDEDKLPLLKKALTMLTEQLRAQDKVSIVVYAGAAGLVLPPTSGNDKAAITNALNRLESGGSTAGGEGIELAYATAKQNFLKEGNNRVILATDGDFNVGVSDDAGLEELIVRKRAEGVFLSVLGFGEGNLQDSKMELLADKGNGNYNYIDGEMEAKKVLVSEFGGTMYTIAKDVKIQVEFNPTNVQSYRLIGYENRKLKNEDFANDKIDAGELGAGHTVTALYEVVPAKGANASSDLKYQQGVVTNPAYAKELLTVKLRYKEPNGTVSKLIEQTLQDDGRNITQTSNDFRWAAAVAAYGMILRQSEYVGNATLDQVIALAKTAIGPDKEGYRREFIELATKAAIISQTARLNVKGNGN